MIDAVSHTLVVPLKVNRLNGEPQGWANVVDVLVPDPFDDCRLPRVVKASVKSKLHDFQSERIKCISRTA